MKSKLIAIVGIMLFAVAGFAGYLNLANVGSFSGSRTDSAADLDVVIESREGVIWNEALYLDVATNATVSVFRALDESEAQAAVSADTSINVYTTSSNAWESAPSVTTSDYILVNDTGSNGYQLRQISAIGAWNSTTNYTTYTLSANVSCAAGSPVYFVDADDVLSIPGVASADQSDLRYMFTSFNRLPVVLRVPSTAGTCVVGGTFKVLN